MMRWGTAMTGGEEGMTPWDRDAVTPFLGGHGGGAGIWLCRLVERVRLAGHVSGELLMKSPAAMRSWWLALLALLAALFFWAVIPLFLEKFAEWLDPWTVNGTRYFFAAMFWLPFVAQALRGMTAGERRGLWRAALGPAAAHTVSQLFFGLGPYFNNATVLNFGCRLSIPFATAFSFWLLTQERPLAKTSQFWLGLAVALGGFFLMFVRGFGTDTTSPAGMWIILGFAVSWGLYVVLIRRNLGGYPPHVSYGVVSLLTFPPLTALMFAVGDWPALGALNPGQWGWLVFSAVLGLTLGHVLYYRSVLTIGPVASESGMLLIPLQTAVMAYFVLGERMAGVQWVAGGVLIVVCALLLRARFRLARGAE